MVPSIIVKGSGSLAFSLRALKAGIAGTVQFAPGISSPVRSEPPALPPLPVAPADAVEPPMLVVVPPVLVVAPPALVVVAAVRA